MSLSVHIAILAGHGVPTWQRQKQVSYMYICFHFDISQINNLNYQNGILLISDVYLFALQCSTLSMMNVQAYLSNTTI